MSQRMRRNASPSTSNVTKQGPLKAVIAFSLKNGAAGSRSSDSSPTTREVKGSEKVRSARKSPDHGLSPERRNPASPNQKEKGRSHFQSPVQYLSVSGCRASSADPVVPYLTGHWPKDIASYHFHHSGIIFMCDKTTQTVDNHNVDQVSDKKKSKCHQRSSSLDHGDLSKEVIKQRLQKTKEGSRHEVSKQRWSPVTGVHPSALSLTAPPTVFARSKPIVIPHSLHIPAKMNRFQRNSVEGLNVEIEKLVLTKSGTTSLSGQDSEDADAFKAHDIPDGHRAPIPEVTRLSCTRTVDTQTPSGQSDDVLSVAADGCGSDPVNPGTPQSSAPCSVRDLLLPDNRSTSVESKSSKGDSEQGSPEPSKFVSSPKPEKYCPFVREPPDGCEKVKVMEEIRQPSIKEPLFCPLKPQFVFRQSQDSAFCPLIKHYLGETGDRPSLRPPSVPLSLSPRLGEPPQLYH